MNTIESNVLIAEFMGEDNDRAHVDLHYHDSWDWLMPVVEKINSLKHVGGWFPFEVIISASNCTIERPTHVGNLRNEDGDSLIQMVYMTIVEFVTWYNGYISSSTIETECDDVFVTCPKCENCEQQPIDQQRHHLGTFQILEWEKENEPFEISHMKCTCCKHEFKLTWDYDNKIETEQ